MVNQAKNVFDNFLFAIKGDLCYTSQNTASELNSPSKNKRAVSDNVSDVRIERSVVMHKFSYFTLPALLVVAVYLCSCVGGGVVDRTDPIIPLPEMKEGTVDPATNSITIVKDDITVLVQHWSRTKLNRKYTNVDTRSIFYYSESWPQAYRTEVFHVTVTNNTPRNVVFSFKESTMEDEREYVYVYQSKTALEDIKYKFVTKKLMDLKTKNSLAHAREILLSEILGKGAIIPPGKTIGGFIYFSTPSTIATKVWLNVVLEKEPEVSTAAYEKVAFRFDYIQDIALLKRQPPVKRF